MLKNVLTHKTQFLKVLWILIRITRHFKSIFFAVSITHKVQKLFRNQKQLFWKVPTNLASFSMQRNERMFFTSLSRQSAFVRLTTKLVRNDCPPSAQPQCMQALLKRNILFLDSELLCLHYFVSFSQKNFSEISFWPTNDFHCFSLHQLEFYFPEPPPPRARAWWPSAASSDESRSGCLAAASASWPALAAQTFWDRQLTLLAACRDASNHSCVADSCRWCQAWGVLRSKFEE